VKRIGLCLIVKNESNVILRCLESARPIVDYVLIEDTGSTDGTQELIRQWLNRVGLPGEVYDEPWRDFGYNRSHVLARLRQRKQLDYALMLDADDYIVPGAKFDPTKFKRTLTAELYEVELRHPPLRYHREQICSNRREFLYRGVLHEFIDTADGARSWKGPKITVGRVSGFHIASTRQGARGDNPEKYLKDAVLLESALATEQDPFLRSRYMFYLARSYNDAGEKQKALDYFLRRAELGYWRDEIFVSLYAAGHLRHALGYPLDQVLATFFRASAVAPDRAEALHAASRLCRENKRYAEGYEYAKRGLTIRPPSSGLFVIGWIYDYGLLDEFAVNACWIERYQDCLDACQRLLQEGKMPSTMHERVNKNAELARQKLVLAENNHWTRK
jgi:glycosyltransferase involved in cell wall biosynthesis